MRKSPKSPVIHILGSVGLAAGLVTTGAAAASADTATDVSDPAQLEAMERDLDLSEGEADQVLQQQNQAQKKEKKLREALGSDFGGAVFDTESGELTVSVTDKDAAKTVRDAGAEAEVVTYGEDALNSVVDTLNEHASDQGKNITGWYPDTAADTVVMTVKPGATGAAEEFVSDTGVDADAVDVQESKESPRKLENIVGGDPFYMGGGGRCSIGFAVTEGFVTAGHCGSYGDSASGSSNGSGTFLGSDFPGSDMAYVGNTSNWNPTSRVSGSAQPVAGSTESSVGASICRSGSTTGWHCGTVEAKNQTVSYPSGTVHGLTRTTVCAEPGDSGGSFISGDQAQGVTSGGSGDCTWGGTTYFQPVNPILDRWDLNLVTS